MSGKSGAGTRNFARNLDQNLWIDDVALGRRRIGCPTGNEETK